ncbi:MAG: toprim domain-containing protein, partial [Phycisphaerales bacterium]|nr:toprim domain-containing protein [Phycisphaerales bacterium]
MAKKKTTKKKTSKKSTKKKVAKKRNAVPDATGKHLVIVESPAKARTINKYLGDDYAVTSSVGHIRDLPARAPKGVKQPVPGVDLEHDFAPTYEVLKGKNSLASDLKKAAKVAKDVWFASDLDREGEAIS